MDTEEDVVDTDEEISAWKIVVDVVVDDGDRRIGSGSRVRFDVSGDRRKKVFDVAVGRHNGKTMFKIEERNDEYQRREDEFKKDVK